MASQDDAIPSLFFWMTAGALCFSSSLAAISTWELLSGDATISIHLTRTSIAQLVVPDILAFVAAWRLRYITSGKARWENEPRRLLLGIMIAQFAAAFIVMVGLVQTGEKPGGSRALLALLVLLISISRETVATRKLQAADEATNPDEQEPLLQQRQRETSTRNGAFTATVGRQFFVLVLWMLIAYSAMQRALDSVVFPPAGKLVRIRGGNQMVHIQCQGEVSDKNAPTILLESGLSIPNVLSWKYVIGPLSNITRVCSIDRPGYGASESGPLPQTTSNIAEVMKLAIDEAGEPGPFVLVGHSFGGYNIRSFAHSKLAFS
ncbi:hypothetical protein BC829DRAFT_302424 [Chytridium lagenaria]|nr:hypothetical protein BC829DRAFT_302424 [Chytridium lagenaria]